MNKAFIFDLDGVLIDDEAIWEKKKQAIYEQLFGPAVHAKLGSTLGINMDGIHDKAVSFGATIDKEVFINECYAAAENIYATAPLTEGLEALSKMLVNLGYRMGIVSASPLSWITDVTKRLPFEDDIELIISLHERPDLAHKPKPDGYLEAMRDLGTDAENTIILEDSNSGIKSAKASGAYTIGLKQNLVEGYEQRGADDYAETMLDVIELVKKQSSLRS